MKKGKCNPLLYSPTASSWCPLSVVNPDDISFAFLGAKPCPDRSAKSFSPGAMGPRTTKCGPLSGRSCGRQTRGVRGKRRAKEKSRTPMRAASRWFAPGGGRGPFRWLPGAHPRRRSSWSNALHGEWRRVFTLDRSVAVVDGLGHVLHVEIHFGREHVLLLRRRLLIEGEATMYLPGHCFAIHHLSPS